MSEFIHRYFTKADLDRLEQAVTDAEGQTEGEIALVITRRSTTWWQDGWLVAALAGLAAALVSMALTHESGWAAADDYVIAAVTGALVFVLTVVLWRLPWARAGTSKQVWKQALRRFAALRPTRARTGVLLYVSLQEKQVAVVADRAIADQVPPDYWDTPRDAIVEAFRAGRQTDGIIAAVQDIGARLAQHFPRRADDANELPNRPVID